MLPAAIIGRVALSTLRFGTRGSQLARRQTQIVADLLQAAHSGLRIEVEVITTYGDQKLDTPLPLIGGKGVFTIELEQALRDGAIDLAVHSLKDLPTADVEGIVIGAIPERASPLDVFISRSGLRLDELPEKAVIGTSSLRRSAQLLARRPDLHLINIRGNVDTRLRKLRDPEGPYDAIVLAKAGLDRLDLDQVVTEVLPPDVMLPAPGQGAIGVQCRADDEALELLAAIQHPAAIAEVTAERSFLSALGGGCSAPVAALGEARGNTLTLRGRIGAIDGSRQIDVTTSGSVSDAYELGASLAREALARGADTLINAAALP